MKTFETEKHNIPEGATHYMNQTSYSYFAWCRYANDRLYATLPVEIDWVHVSEDIFDRNIKPIPQTNIETPEEKEVEWVNGDTVEYRNKHEGEGVILTFVGINPTHKGYAVLYGKHLAGGYVSAPLSMLSKPETEAERAERERLEAAYDLYCELNANHNYVEFDRFKINFNNWIRVARKAGYRKESE